MTVTQANAKPLSKAEEAGTLLSILNSFGSALSVQELSQIKSRLFDIVNLDIIQGPTLADLRAEQAQREMMDYFNDEAETSTPQLEVVQNVKTKEESKGPEDFEYPDDDNAPA